MPALLPLLSRGLIFTDFSTTLSSEPIKAPLDKTLSILQDPKGFTSLSKLFKSIDGPDSTGKFVVTETLPILDIFNSSTKADVRYTVNPDGLSSAVDASAGTHLDCKWVATDNGDGTTTVKEDIKAKALTIFGQFVWGTLQENHKVTLANLKTKVESLD